MSPTLAAVDLGASSGRVIAGTFADGRLRTVETARFPNGPIGLPTGAGPRLFWPILRLWEAVRCGLAETSHRMGPLDGVGIDTWGVDYGLLDASGELVGLPAAYRCARTAGVPERLFRHIPAAEMYAATGAQTQPFNTVFQVLAESRERLGCAGSLLLLPDLLGYWLTGVRVGEVTNASTTGLVDPRTRSWAQPMIARIEDAMGTPIARLLPALVEPGAVLGPVRPDVVPLTTAGGDPTPLIAVGSHDTASAVAAVPATRPDFAYISCGTWSLVGLELDAPVLTQESRRANFTNELGVEGTIRHLKNVMGLWILSQAVAGWRDEGHEVDVAALARAAERASPLRTIVDVDDPMFLPPGPMVARIERYARLTGQPVPDGPVETTRCILDSLAVAYRRAVRTATELTGQDVSVVHVVGGGVNNHLLMQLTADATGVPVVAGPCEGTALGNVLHQAQALQLMPADRWLARAVVRDSVPLTTYHPVPARGADWAAADRRLSEWLHLTPDRKDP